MTLQPTLAEATTDGATTDMVRRIVVIDDEDRYREALDLELSGCGFELVGFKRAEGALEYFSAGHDASAILLEWRTPAIDGPETLRSLRQRGVECPVIFLTSKADQNSEDAALRLGAVDFIDKTRRASIVLKRLRLITRHGSPAAPSGAGTGCVSQGPLVLSPKTLRAYWKGAEIELTRTEYAILHLLASRPDTDIGYREIYDVARGKDFMAGKGSQGYKANVRSFIKRIRRKARAVDPDFDCIKNYFGFGYRWHCPPADAALEPAQLIAGFGSRASALLEPRRRLQSRARRNALAASLGSDQARETTVIGA